MKRFFGGVWVAGVAMLAVAGEARAAAPTITSFSPPTGAITSKVTIVGTNFTGATAVKFDGIASLFTVTSATQISATLPATATGTIAVTTAGGTATSASAYTVQPGVQPVPAVGPPSSTLTVNASGFAHFSSIDVYFDSTDIALAVSNNIGVVSISVSVPATASPGVHWVTLDQRSNHMAAQTKFSVQTDWAQGGFAYNSRYDNPWEGSLSSTTVPLLDSLWIVNGGIYGNATPLVEKNNVIYSGDVQGIVRAYSSAGVLNWTASAGVSLSPFVPVAGATYVYFAGGTKVFAYKVGCATNGATCTPSWTTDIGTNVTAGLTIFNNVLYVPGADAALHTVNPATGALETPVTNVFGQTGAITTPVSFAVDGSLYYGIGDAFEAAHPNGNASEFTSNGAVSPAAVSGGIAYYTSSDGYLYQSGGAQWTTSIPSGCASAPALANGFVYVVECGTIAAYRSDSGALYWSATTTQGEGGASNGISVANGVVYACVGGVIDAYLASYGGFLWSGGICSGAPIVANATVYGAYAGIEALTVNGVTPSVVKYRPLPSALRPVEGLVRQVTVDQ